MSFEMVQESAIVGGSCSDVWNLMKSFEFKWQSNITTVKPGDIDKASREELIFKLTFDDKLELYANILDISEMLKTIKFQTTGKDKKFTIFHTYSVLPVTTRHNTSFVTMAARIPTDMGKDYIERFKENTKRSLIDLDRFMKREQAVSPRDDSFHVIVNVLAKDDAAAEEYIKILKQEKFVQTVRNDSDCHECVFVRCNENKRIMKFVERFKDDQAFQKHMDSALVKYIIKKTEPLVDFEIMTFAAV